MDHSFGRQNWFENHAAEHRAARETVALFDQTAFGKLTVQGADALALMQRLCANDVDVDVLTGQLRLSSSGTIGGAVNHLETAVGVLSARAAAAEKQ